MRVLVEPFVRQPDGEEVLIGLPGQDAFLAVPQDVVDILDELAQGKSIQEVAAAYQLAHGVEPDIQELLAQLEPRGFVQILRSELRPGDDHPRPRQAPRPAHFEWIPQGWARAIWSPSALGVCGGIILFALVLVVVEPQLRPSYRSAFSAPNAISFLGVLMAFGLLTTFFHEMAHLLAARAQGVSCRFGIGNRLWFVVWETDMTGIWGIPRRNRYLPILAGPFADLTGAAALVLFQAAVIHGYLTVPPEATRVAGAFCFIYVMRICWQCYLFLRTDFYYALINLLGCRNLMEETRLFLSATVRHWLFPGPNPKPRLSSGREAWWVRIYSIVWLAGRVFAIGILLLVQLPLFMLYLNHFWQSLAGDSLAMTRADTITGLFFTGFLTWGLTMWIRELMRARRMEHRS